MARLRGAQYESVYQAAELFVDQALRNEGSLFTPGQAVWSKNNINDLYNRFIVNADENTEASFLEKIQGQLSDAPPIVYQLVSELLYVHLLIATGTLDGPTKRNMITTVLSWSPKPVSIPAELDQAIDSGLTRVGSPFITSRLAQIQFLIEVMHAWHQRSSSEQNRYLHDPWAFKQFVYEQPIKRAQLQREALLHLVYPDYFEPIVSHERKNNLATTFANIVVQADNDVDKQLYALQSAYQANYGENLNFTDKQQLHKLGQISPNTVSQPKNLASLPTENTRAVGALPQSLENKLSNYARLIAQWEANTHYTPSELVDWIEHTNLKIVQTKPDAEQLIRDLSLLRSIERHEVNGEIRYGVLPDLVGQSEATIMRYQALTLLIPTEQGDYELPIVRAPFDGQPHPSDQWPYGSDLLNWYHEAGLIEPINTEWRSLPNTLEVQTDDPTILQAFIVNLHKVKSSQSERKSDVHNELRILPLEQLKQRIKQVQQRLQIDELTIKRIYRALIAGQHVILSGPPGTGKTDLAKMLPSLLWSDDEASTIEYSFITDPWERPDAELHQTSYARKGYAVELATATEDWGIRQVMGGITPQLLNSSSGQSLGYSMRLGVLSRTVLSNYANTDGDTIPSEFVRREVRDNEGNRYHGRWLVIDEFTRAPIDAAFGSLLTTLGDNENPVLRVPNAQGNETVVPMPSDFRIIGTLNSFDRHFLNQISEAMKRRFAFIDVLPPSREQRQAEQQITLTRIYDQLIAKSIDFTEHLSMIIEREGNNPPRFSDAEAQQAVEDFWRIFWAIRNYRQLGTAQAKSTLHTLLVGITAGLTWAETLDSALADVLGDQLQVLARDEQRALLAYLQHAGQPREFAKQLKEILTYSPKQRQQQHLQSLQLSDLNQLEEAHLAQNFDLGQDLLIKHDGLFARRLQAFINDRGL